MYESLKNMFPLPYYSGIKVSPASKINETFDKSIFRSKNKIYIFSKISFLKLRCLLVTLNKEPRVNHKVQT